MTRERESRFRVSSGAITSGPNLVLTSFSVGAAPHLPAGILSPNSNGERDALIDGFANLQR
ncbi:MAG: hypothetical protein E5Y67_34225, partial [Mesorhizobium sp.]